MKKFIFIFLLISLIFPQKVYAENLLYGILTNNDISAKNISSFEKNNGTHEIYAFKYDEKTAFPQILSCKLKNKTPYIIFDEETDFKKAAKAVGRANTECFAEIFPLTANCKYAKNEYISLFQNASAEFKKNAPKTDIVYSFSLENINKAKEYFPTKYYADKAGFIYYIKQNTDMLTAYLKVKEACEMFDMPIIFSRFGVSHFSVETENYSEQYAARFIKNFYELTEKEFPKTEAIIYSNLYISEKMPDGTYVNDYRITEPSGLAENYKNIVMTGRK